MKGTDKWKNRVVLIPAYEPDGKLTELVHALYAAGFGIVAVDDGSSSGCGKIFETIEQEALVLHHAQNRGKGAALKTGLARILEMTEPGTVVITADADGQHRPEDIRKIAEEANAHPDSLILGSRSFEGKVPLRSRLGNSITRGVFRLATGRKISDTQTGLRAFAAKDIPAMLDISGERYEYEMNVLMQLSRAGRPIREVPIRTVYLEGNASSHFDTITDSWRIYREIARFSASSLMSFLLDCGLFWILSGATGQIVLSNILARLVSAAFNYSLNRRMVFGNRSSIFSSLPAYAALAAVILAFNTALLSLLTGAGLGRLAAKILTEVLLFGLSWSVQHYLIFRKEENYERS